MMWNTSGFYGGNLVEALIVITVVFYLVGVIAEYKEKK